MTPTNPRSVALLQDEVLTRLARSKFEAFVELAWPVLEPTTPFLSNWHLSLIAEYLEAVTAGQIQRLVINMPPRYGKSLLTSVLWPVWEWIQFPSRRWLFVSHSDTLAKKHSLDRRLLIQHEWFRRRFPGIRLTQDQQAKAEFHNTRRGAMIATSMGGSITGKGGDRLVIDDPHSPDQVESDLQRQHAIDRFRISLSTRLDDKAHGAMVLVMQRLHTQDLSGLCLDLGFEHLCLPALAPKRTTILFPVSKKSVVREAEEPLWVARENRETLDQLRITLGSFGFAGQYQQDPLPRTGGMFPREWWRYYDALPATGRVQFVQSWDLTFKDSDGSDYVVGLVAARVGALVYLLDRFREKANFVATARAIQDMVARYPETSAVLIEDAANGPAIVDSLKGEIPGLMAVSPEGGKVARAHAVQPWIEAGQVHLPTPFSESGAPRHDRRWVDAFIGQCAAFPKAAHDDDVDALTQLLVWLRQNPHVEPAFAVRKPEPFFKPRLNMFPRRNLLHQRNAHGDLASRAHAWVRRTTTI